MCRDPDKWERDPENLHEMKYSNGNVNRVANRNFRI